MWTRVGSVLTGITMRLVGKAHKGFGRTLALWQGGWGLWCHRARSGITWPHPMEHAGQPHQGDQHQLVEKEIRDHGKTHSYRWRNESILPGFQTVGISRSVEVHDRALWVRTVACGELHSSLLMRTVCRASGVYSERPRFFRLFMFIHAIEGQHQK